MGNFDTLALKPYTYKKVDYLRNSLAIGLLVQRRVNSISVHCVPWAVE